MKIKIISVLVAVSVITAILLNVKICSVEDYYSENMESLNDTMPSFFLEIRCDTAQDYENPNLSLIDGLPSNGAFVEKTEFVLGGDYSAYDGLIKVLKYKKITAEFDNSPSGVYVKAIGGLYEYACGDLSGWLYKVNGEFCDRSCDKIKLNDGDFVSFVYTCDLGRDVGGYKEFQ